MKITELLKEFVLFLEQRDKPPSLYGYSRDGDPLYCVHNWVSSSQGGFAISQCSKCKIWENII